MQPEEGLLWDSLLLIAIPSAQRQILSLRSSPEGKYVPFWLSEVKQLVLFMLLHYFNFLFPSFAGFQVHPEAMTLIAASWGGCMDHRQSGGLTSGYEVRIAHSFCIFKCINTFWLLLFFPHLMSMQYLRRSHSQSQFTGKNCMSVLCFVWVFQLNQPRTCGCSYVNRKATCS